MEGEEEEKGGTTRKHTSYREGRGERAGIHRHFSKVESSLIYFMKFTIIQLFLTGFAYTDIGFCKSFFRSIGARKLTLSYPINPVDFYRSLAGDKFA